MYFTIVIRFVISCHLEQVSIINGAPIKGSRTYPTGLVTFRELKEELPFPTKMVSESGPREHVDLVHK